jgi:hypothetical protein
MKQIHLKNCKIDDSKNNDFNEEWRTLHFPFCFSFFLA